MRVPTAILCHRGWVNVEGTGAIGRWHLSQCDRANGTGHAAIVGLAARGVFLDHRDEVVVAADLAE